jgi:hypothetical protein
MKKEIVKIGDWDLKNSSLLDNNAYYLYCCVCVKEVKEYERYVMYTQTGFHNSVDNEKYYNKAKIILREQKIKKIKNL